MLNERLLVTIEIAKELNEKNKEIKKKMDFVESMYELALKDLEEAEERYDNATDYIVEIEQDKEELVDELEWYREENNQLEQENNRMMDEIFELKEKIEELESKYVHYLEEKVWAHWQNIKKDVLKED